MAASTSSRSARRALLVLPLALLAGAAFAQAPAQVSVRVVMIRATGERKGGPETIPPALVEWSRTLAELGYATYECVGDLTGTGPFQQKIRFEHVPPPLGRHVVDVVATSEPDGQRIALKVDIARWPAGVAVDTPDVRLEKVIGIPLRVDPGSHFAVRVTDGLGSGQHLLLLVSATRVTETPPAAPTTPAPPGG